MAYGTETVPRVDVICGPGNAYVMEAKRQVYGSVGIDSLAGPSEVLVVADPTARPEWVAADMLAQEEHGSGAEALLVAETRGAVRGGRAGGGRPRGGARRPRRRPRRPRMALPSWGPGGSGPSTRRRARTSSRLAAALVNDYAPEHLEIQVADPRAFLARVRSAGAIFLGHRTPTAFGDYIAGSNHVLPTGGSARFSSPLSVDTFMRRSSFVEMTADAARLLTPRLAQLADSEGFSFHRRLGGAASEPAAAAGALGRRRIRAGRLGGLLTPRAGPASRARREAGRTGAPGPGRAASRRPGAVPSRAWSPFMPLRGTAGRRSWPRRRRRRRGCGPAVGCPRPAVRPDTRFRRSVRDARGPPQDLGHPGQVADDRSPHVDVPAHHVLLRRVRGAGLRSRSAGTPILPTSCSIAATCRVLERLRRTSPRASPSVSAWTATCSECRRV